MSNIREFYRDPLTLSDVGKRVERHLHRSASHAIQKRLLVANVIEESPLEQAFRIRFYGALWSLALQRDDPANYYDYDLKLIPQRWVEFHETDISKRYRLDFEVIPWGRESYARWREHEDMLGRAFWKPTAVELDGHAFHEKTPEQVQHRNTRDRHLQERGWVVFHYNYKEIVSDDDTVEKFAFDCVQRLRLARQMFHEAAMDAANKHYERMASFEKSMGGEVSKILAEAKARASCDMLPILELINAMEDFGFTA